jgi:hypothetical protein
VKLLNIDRIIESAICADDAGVAGVANCALGSAAAGIVIEEGDGLIDSDDLPNIDLIIESAICAGDTAVTGFFAVFAIAWNGS